MAKAPTLSGKNTAPGGALRAITPHASNALPDGPSRSIFVGTGGDLSVILFEDSSAVLLKNIANGTLLPLRVKAVRATGTTAADLVAIY